MTLIENAFDSLPRRIFLDSCTVQTLGQYGSYIWEREPISSLDPIHAVTAGLANVEALRSIFLVVNERAPLEWIVSEASLREAQAKRDFHHGQWAQDIMDHTQLCLLESGGATEASAAFAQRLDRPQFGYLSRADRELLHDALLLRCDAFLTMEQRLPRNAMHLYSQLGLRVLDPVDYWELLEPWADLFR